jgi:CRP-like cAMP-binding protein
MSTQNEIQALILASDLAKHSVGSIVFHQGDAASGVYIVRKGKIRLFIRNPVTQQITFDRSAGPGSLLGLPAVFGDKPYSMSAEVLEEAELGFLERNRFMSLMEQDGRLCMRCLQMLSDEVRIARTAASR